MVGIPPACGFFSKWYLVLGCVDAANWVFVAVILASSLLNAVYFFRIIEKAYTGKVDGSLPEPVRIEEAPASMLAPVLVLATGIVVLGFANAYIVTYLLEPLVKGL
jgi:multicomponent Na+:H+ antiporter subunit D